MTMHSSLLFAVLLVAVGLAQAKIDYVESEKQYDICKKETEATETFEDVVKNQKIPTSDKGMCLIECLMRQKGIYKDDGTFNPEGTKMYFDKVFGHLPGHMEKAIAIAEDCAKTTDVEGLDKCEAAVKRVTCARTKSVQQKIDLKD